VLIGKNDPGRFGWDVSNRGDLNNDGYSDIIVGAPNFSGEGSAFIYYGSAVMDTVADLTISSFSGDNSFAASVSFAGDVNNDDYDDIIIGLYDDHTHGEYAGAAHIYFGGSSINKEPSMVFMPENAYDHFGQGVASAGDVNGDGCADIIVGAPGYDLGMTFGRSYVYFSSQISVQPGVFSASDIANDQGGYVQINWSRSAYDESIHSKINEYTIQRSLLPPARARWENIATVPASFDKYYAFTAETPYDSTSENPAICYYRVMAHSTDGEIWKSKPVAAYSVDNLAPSESGFLKAVQVGNNSVQLTWERNRTDPDVQHYAVYRSLEAGFVPDAENFLTATSDTTFLDQEPYDQQDSFYKVVTFDIHENPSVASPEAAIFFDSSLPVFLSSFSATATANAQVRIDFVTASEINVLGFNIWRAMQKDGEYQLVASYLDYPQLVGQGNSSQGTAYSWTDVHTESNREYWYKLECIDLDGSSEFYKAVSARVIAVPTEFALRPNYPNPFNPETVIEYHLPVSSDGRLEVYNLLGQQITAFEFKNKEPGIYKYTFDGAGLPSGMYIYRLTAKGDYHGEKRVFTRVRKMVLVK
jgi:hypothetical protein